METSKFFLTGNGNVLVDNGNEFYGFYMGPDGKFLRYAGKNEIAFISQKAREIKFVEEITLPELIKWEYLWTTQDKDLSNYDPETCFNGGNYSYTTTYHYFCRNSGGVVEFCVLELCSSSSDFTYTDDGRFDENFHSMEIIGLSESYEGRSYYRTQRFYQSGEVALDQIATPTDIKTALYATGNNGHEEEVLTMAEKFERIKVVKEKTGISVMELLKPKVNKRRK